MVGTFNFFSKFQKLFDPSISTDCRLRDAVSMAGLDAMIASSSTWGDGYLEVPSIKREEKCSPYSSKPPEKLADASIAKWVATPGVL